MNNEYIIKAAIGYAGTNQAKLAEALGTTSSNFNQKLKKDTFSRKELEKMAEALGATYRHWYFEFPNNIKIGE